LSTPATDLAAENSETLLIVPGQSALSEFRLAKLRQALQNRDARIASVNARLTYFVSLRAPLASTLRERLDALLLADEAVVAFREEAQTLTVIPRPGTISPWSSKATDIARACGLDSVNRIERGITYALGCSDHLASNELLAAGKILFDRMTESLLEDYAGAQILFETHSPEPLLEIPLLSNGADALRDADKKLGLALSNDEIDYLLESYIERNCNPTDAELMMFAQANSEHCRHKIFRADWIIDGIELTEKLFDMIKSTTEASGAGVISAYSDNCAVIEGHFGRRLISSSSDRKFEYCDEPIHILMKVETHNHPTAISPYPGAATGSGGEIRDEGATGLGARPKAGLSGFTVSHLRIPGYPQPWEQPFGHPDRMATPLEIMLEGPIGGAAFNNEFGRPNLLGYFRTFEARVPGLPDDEIRGYHKPIMIAGGVGNVRAEHALKKDIPVGAKIVVIGGPAMLIGLGGGAASSLASGTSSEDLDFASVQRGNPEMERRAQEVIDRCCAMGPGNPILLIHDVGAGGLSNAVPEAVDHSKHGAVIELREIPNAEPGMSPMAIWCNEAQERYVIIIADDRVEEFASICQRERCPYAVIGTLTDDRQLRVFDREFGNKAVDMPMEVLLGKAPRMTRDVTHLTPVEEELDLSGIELEEAIFRVLRFPAVADKSFLIHIGDRTVGGLSVRDQLIGPWQVPVSDAAITASGFESITGEAMSMGERTPLAVLNAPASGRMAVGEAITNIACADIGDIEKIRLSANWMAAAGHPGEDANLFDTVKAVGLELCQELGIAIPVGKDSLSMRARWDDGGRERQVVAPVSLIVSAFAPVRNIRQHQTPELRRIDEPSRLLLFDLGEGAHRMGGSCLAQSYGMMSGKTPDLDDADRLRKFFAAIQSLASEGLLLAYHDRSDGGLLATVAEMMFASRLGSSLQLAGTDQEILRQLFNEELGAVIQIRESQLAAVHAVLEKHDCPALDIGSVATEPKLTIQDGDTIRLQIDQVELRRAWSATSYRMQALRDNPDTAKEEYDRLLDMDDPGLGVHLTFDPSEKISSPSVVGTKPRIAVLREQGVNSQYEMAAAFMRAGFDAVDVHMSDLLEGRDTLAGYQGIVACGGFSFGDVLGAGGGWAKSILNHERTREQFAGFFARSDGFALGVCNGCQMFSHLKSLIPGAENWPRFLRNRSEQFEARLSLVTIDSSPSIFLANMDDCRIPIVTSHGEGRATFSNNTMRSLAEPLVALRYTDNYGNIAQSYPANPNGSIDGICGLTTADGRVTIMMPHPERVVRTTQNSWHPEDWRDDGPWMRIFRNARNAVA
jgi:phosphoribosylformylglycinamidine synthase